LTDRQNAARVSPASRPTESVPLDWGRHIVSDARGMRQEIKSLKKGLTSEIRIGAV